MADAGVVVDGEEVAADAVVIAMGPWSGQAAKWLPVPDITGQKYASIVLRPEEEISNHMLFLSYRTSSGAVQLLWSDFGYFEESPKC